MIVDAPCSLEEEEVSVVFCIAVCLDVFCLSHVDPNPPLVCSVCFRVEDWICRIVLALDQTESSR